MLKHGFTAKDNSSCTDSSSDKELLSFTESWDADESQISQMVSANSTDSFITAGNMQKRLEECTHVLTQVGTDLLDLKATKDLDYIAQALKNNSTEKEKQKEIVNILARNKFHIVLYKSLAKLDSYDLTDSEIEWKVARKSLTQCWIVSDASKNFCEHSCSYEDTLELLVRLLRKLSSNIENVNTQTNIRYMTKALLGIVHNINRHLHHAKDMFHDLDIIPVLKIIATSNIPMIQAKSFLVLSYVVKETEIAMLNADTRLMEFIACDVLQDAYRSHDHISKRFGMNVDETLRGLFNLAASDQNKELLVSLGVLPIYVKLIMQYAKTEEVFQAVMGIWRLAFQPHNKTSIRNVPHCTEALISLQSSSDEMIKHAARGALWELREQACLTVDTKLMNQEISCPHIMISYQWDNQHMMIKVKNKLQAAGFKVWMDVEHMTGSTLEAMALAVERSAVVLLCMSQKYKDSPNCRSEAEYIYKLRKGFVPLRVQMNYTPDGWLGMLIGTRLFFDFSTEDLMEQQFPSLVKELGKRGKIGASQDTVDGSPAASSTGYNATALKPLYEGWSKLQVCEWIEGLGLSSSYQELCFLDGKLLAEFKAIKETSPDFFFKCLRDDLQLSFNDMLKFSQGIRLL